jgi:hypothetical protein
MPRRALPLALLFLLVTAGCLGSSDDPAVREDRAIETLESASDAAAAVESDEFDVGIRVSARTADGSERYTVDGNGRVNVTARTMVMETRSRGRTLESYVDGRTAYQACPPNSMHWASQNVTADDWSSAAPLGRQLALLSTGDLYYNGTETEDGREVVHLSGRPSLSALQDRLEVGATSLPDADRIERLELHAWFDAETQRLIRSRFSATAADNGQEASVTLRIRFHDYGAPVDVTVPDEARDAFFDDGCPG